MRGDLETLGDLSRAAQVGMGDLQITRRQLCETELGTITL